MKRKVFPFTRFEEMDKDTGICFPVQVVVFLALKSIFVHKSIQSGMLVFLMVFVSSSTQYQQGTACQSEFLGLDVRSLDRQNLISFAASGYGSLPIK